MVEFTKQELDAFMSKMDFDFSKASDWKEFLAERSAGGTGRDADGIQLRDIKNYSVGTATVIAKDGPVKAQFNVRTLGSGLVLPQGVLYVYHPDADWTMTVSRFYVGPPDTHAEFSLDVAGPSTDGTQYWGSLYYIIIKSGQLPGQGIAESIGKRALKEALKGGSWLARRGFKLLTIGEAGYTISVRVGGGEWISDYFIQQEVISDQGMDRIKKTAQDAWDYLFE